MTQRQWTILGLVALALVAGAIRFYDLGAMDTRGDEVELYEFMQAGYQPGQYWSYTWDAFKTNRQMPIPRVTVCAFVRWLGLDNSLLSIRIPFAIVGTAAVLALWLLGFHIRDRSFGWLLAFLGCINPYLVFWSRFAHVYAFPILFMTLTAAFFAACVRAYVSDRRIPWRDIALMSLSSALANYSHMSAWPATTLLWILLAVLVYRRQKRDGRPVLPVLISVIAGGAAWAVLLLPWGLQFLDALQTAKGSFLKSDGNPAAEIQSMYRIPLQMTWGWGFPRGIATVALLSFGFVGGWFNATWRPVVKCLLLFMFGIFACIAFMLGFAGGMYSVRYFLPIWVSLMIASGIGLVVMSEEIATRVKWKPPLKERGWLLAGCAVLAALMFNPVKWVVTLPGNPVPFSRVSQWLDENLPEGTPVLADGMLRVQHEWRPHWPKKVHATFSVPDVGLEMYLKNRWRDASRQFFLKYPDAAFVEFGRAHYNVPGVGPWEWPRTHFRQHVVITNEQALALRRTELAPTEDYYNVNDGDVMVNIYYNTKPDIVQKARERGINLLALYGPGWRYVKTQDFRDWRVLEGGAAIELRNLTSTSQDVAVIVKAVAINGVKKVTSSPGAEHTFENMRLVEWPIGPVTIPPGGSQINLNDALWPMAQVPLLVERIDIQAVPAP